MPNASLRLPRPLLPVAFVLLVAAPAAAQIEFPTKEKIGEPPGQKEQAAAPEAPPAPPPTASGFWDQDAGRVVEVYRAFELEAVISQELLRKYLDRLRGFGLDEPRRVALKALAAPHLPSVELSARLLEYVGEMGDAGFLVECAAGIGSINVATVCLETALRLNGGSLPFRAVRLLDHPQHSLRAAAESRLSRSPHDSYQPALLQLLLYGRDSDARLRAARLLRSFSGRPEVRQALLQALLDAAVPVAFQAAEALTGSGKPEEIQALRADLLAAEPGVKLSYLYYALLQEQQNRAVLLIDEELLPKLQSCLGEPDLFLSGTAAALLGEYNYRAESPEGLGVLEREIAYVLVRAVGGQTFYPQYARFVPLGEACLIRITGENFSHSDRSAWLAWFADNHQSFRAVRGTLDVLPEDHERLCVSWRDESGGEFALAGLAADGGAAAARFLGPLEAAGLVQALEEARLLHADVLPGVYGDLNSEVRCRLEIEIGRRRKPLTFRGQAGASWLPEVLQRLQELYQSHAWQKLAPPGQERAFAAEHLPRWDGASEAERRALKLELTARSLATLSNEILVEWCAHLAADPGLDALWSSDLSDALLEEIPARAGDPALARALLAAALRRPLGELTHPLLSVAQDLAEPLRSDLLLDGLQRLGPAAAMSCLGDERLPVRVAAARALGKAGAVGRDALLGALGDSNPLVVRMAIRSLGELRDAGVLAAILPYAAAQAPKEIRKETLWALGEIGHLDALEPVFAAAAPLEDPGVRLAAVDALGKLPGFEVDRRFSALFPFYAGDALEVPYLRALELRGAGVARRVLGEHLAAFEPEVARRAAIHCGRLGLPDAAGALMEFLPESPHDPELLEALVACTGADFRTTPDPAGVYTAWWRENSRLDPTAWFLRAAGNSKLSVPEDFMDAQVVSRKTAAQAVLQVLELGPPPLRPLASYYLHQLTGVDAPALQLSTPAPVVEKVAANWRAWIEARSEG